MADSTVVVAIDALVAVLRARPGLAGVQVEGAWPGRDQERECVFVGDVFDGNDEIAAMRAGPKPRNEAYELQVLIEVDSPGGTQRDADARVLALKAELEAALAADPTLGLNRETTGFSSAVAVRFRMRRRPTDEGHTSAAEVRVRCTARL